MADKRDKDVLKNGLYLGKEAQKSVERLKEKIPNANEKQLVRVSLQVLERKWNIVVKRKARERSRLLKKKGMNFQQIAERLNKENFSSPTGFDRWNVDMVTKLSK
ncbi:MAG: hypothetical protein U9R17_15935 [Thermodesulfobacteriota bacterium]|nr:hypothetical protein [Thermodesulfobacteriota bacterium]